MRPLADIECALGALRDDAGVPKTGAHVLLALAEETLEHWVCARGGEPTAEAREGFRLLALHHQGCKGMPSFNACRETCREIAYHYNLIVAETDTVQAARYAQLLALLVMHLFLFVSGKLEEANLGEFCCSARPLHAAG